MAHLVLTPASQLVRLIQNTNRGQNFSPKLLRTVQVNANTQRMYFEDSIIVEAVKEANGETTAYYRDDEGRAIDEYGNQLDGIAIADLVNDAKEPKTTAQYYQIAKSQIDDDGEIKPTDAAITVTSLTKDLMPEAIPGILRVVTFSDGTQLSIFHASDGDQPALNFLDSSGNETTKPRGESTSPDAGFKL